MIKHGFLIFILLIHGFANYAQDWSGMDFNPDQHGLEYNPLKGFMTLWNPGNSFPHSIQGHSFGLDELMTGMNSFNWKALEDALNKDILNGNFSSIQVIIDPANGTTKLPLFLRDQVDWKLKPGSSPSLCPDWNNETLMMALLNFIAAFGDKYDGDSRIFAITLGLYGMWGEWHVGSDKTFEMTPANKSRIANAYSKAFSDMNLMARYATAMPDPQIYGYSDGLVFGQSMYFYNQLKSAHADQNWKQHIISGEIDPGLQSNIWKSWPNTVGEDVTTIINTVHPTFLISHYVLTKLPPSTMEWDNAIRAQKMMGYMLYVHNYRLTAAQGKITVEVEIQNNGVAPMYANWDAEIGVIDADNNFQVIGKTKMNLRTILPDEQKYYRAITASNVIGDGTYTVIFRIVNPLEMISSKAQPLRFANTNQDADKTGWLTLGKMTINSGVCGEPPVRVSGITTSPASVRLPVRDTLRLSANVLPFNATRKSIFWSSDHPAIASVDSTGLITAGSLFGQATITAVTHDGGFMAENIIYVGELSQKTWTFPGDTVPAWGYKYFPYLAKDTLFALDSATTIGIYGCNDTTGLNIRFYYDAGKFKDAAQFKWNIETETFQRNGQWVDFATKFSYAEPYQLLIRAKNTIDANFKLTILSLKGDTLFFKDVNLKEDFLNQGGANEQTDWMLSNFQLQGLSSANIVRFDWYDNVGEPGVFGSFSFVESGLDFTPPSWYFVSIGDINVGNDIEVITIEDAKVYLVPDTTPPVLLTIQNAAVGLIDAAAYALEKISTSGLVPGNYIVYAVDNSGNISEASQLITLTSPVSIKDPYSHSDITVTYNSLEKLLRIKSSNLLSQIDLYNMQGQKIGSKMCNDSTADYKTNTLLSGLYIIRVVEKCGFTATRKIVL